MAAISPVMPAGMRLLAGLARSMAPIENCVILDSAPVGVHEVSAIEFAQMIDEHEDERQRDEREQPRHAEVIRWRHPCTQHGRRSGGPRRKSRAGIRCASSTSAPSRACALFRLKALDDHLRSARAGSPSSPPPSSSHPTIATTGSRSPRARSAIVAPVGPMRGAMSPAWIMIGARTAKLMQHADEAARRHRDAP